MAVLCRLGRGSCRCGAGGCGGGQRVRARRARAGTAWTVEHPRRRRGRRQRRTRGHGGGRVPGAAVRGCPGTPGRRRAARNRTESGGGCTAEVKVRCNGVRLPAAAAGKPLVTEPVAERAGRVSEKTLARQYAAGECPPLRLRYADMPRTPWRSGRPGRDERRLPTRSLVRRAAGCESQAEYVPVPAVRRVASRPELAHARRSRRSATTPPPRAHRVCRAGAEGRAFAAARGRGPNTARTAGATPTPNLAQLRSRSRATGPPGARWARARGRSRAGRAGRSGARRGS